MTGLGVSCHRSTTRIGDPNGRRPAGELLGHGFPLAPPAAQNQDSGIPETHVYRGPYTRRFVAFACAELVAIELQNSRQHP